MSQAEYLQLFYITMGIFGIVVYLIVVHSKRK